MKNKKYWLLTSLVTLLPIAVGLLLWNELPDRLPTHFGPDGGADGWSGKAFAVFGVPLMMLFFHWVICFATRLDRQNQGHNGKVLKLVGLILPAMSVVYGVLICRTGLGLEMDMSRIMLPLLGLIFLLVGNWLPKIKQNSTLGVKLPWTLYNEENWNRTHRVAGYTWVLGGIVILCLGFVPNDEAFGWAIVVLMVLMAGLPTLYSWNLARKQRAAGTYTESAVNRDLNRHPVIKAVSMVLVALILVAVCVLMFTGGIDYTCTDTALVIEADYWDDLTVALADIDAVEYRDAAPEGVREFGWGSGRLMLGLFSNGEFGNHIRYSYTGCEAYIVLRAGDDVLVLTAEDETATRELYEELAEKVG